MYRGPLLGQLKQGQDVTLPDGTVVRIPIAQPVFKCLLSVFNFQPVTEIDI